MMLRILFELKTIFADKSTPHLLGSESTQPKQFLRWIHERIELFQILFWDFFRKELAFIGGVSFVAALIGYWKGYKTLDSFQKKMGDIYFSTDCFSLLIPCFTKNKFLLGILFWGNTFHLHSIDCDWIYIVCPKVHPKISIRIIFFGVLVITMMLDLMNEKRIHQRKLMWWVSKCTLML